MSRPLVLVTRPQPQAAALATVLRQEGVEVLVDPLLRIVPTPQPIIDLCGVQAILLTSVNGVRALAAATTVRDIPVFAVGEASAVAARDVGFTIVTAADGDAISLVALVRSRLEPQHGRLWHGRGADIAHDLDADLSCDGFDVKSEILYTAKASSTLAPETSRHLREGNVQSALFFSPRTALTFVTLVRGARLENGVDRCVACALSANVAKALSGLPWAEVRVAEQPSQAALLEVWRGCLERNR